MHITIIPNIHSQSEHAICTSWQREFEFANTLSKALLYVR